MFQLCQPWPLDPTCLPDDWSANPSEWTQGQRRAVEIASEYLWWLTAGRFGLCDEQIRPCLQPCQPSSGSHDGPRPRVVDGRWVNVTCGCGGRGCSCTRVCEIQLPGPVGNIQKVVLDGEVLPGPGEPGQVWRIDNQDWLVRVDGGCWPRCQDMTVSDYEPGAFLVQYQRGIPVPAAGSRAVTAAAVELDKQCRGARGCRLPAGTIQADRENLTYKIDAGSSGVMTLPEVSQFVGVVNPDMVPTPPAVLSPDLPKPRSRAGLDRLRVDWEPSSGAGGGS